jgi:hypothetical protein
VSSAGKPVPRKGTSGSTDPVLRAKYLDFCSARVAEVLLHLSADDMYLLAQDAARESGRSGDESLTYEEIVRLATERISRKLSLPPFDAWIEAYRAEPDRYDREMLGLWETELRGEDPSRE